MFVAGDVLDGRYRVDGPCSSSGGMGEVLFVTPLQYAPPPFRLVLKYCKVANDDYLKRFRREARLLKTFQGNSKIVQLWDENLEHDPPYVVMKFYVDGDLSREMYVLQSRLELQERYFLRMIECIQELHSRNEFHRDIKPQNFLREGEAIVVSDFGLSTEVGSATAFTSSSAWWGTHGYIPPEFMSGGFKNADAAGDIYMLGKTFYVLLTGREPAFLTGDGIPPPLYHVLTRCCSVVKEARYQSLAELKQSLVVAYDVLLGRTGGKAQQLFTLIKDRAQQSGQYQSEEIAEFVEQLGLIDQREQIQMCFEVPQAFFSFISHSPSLPTFLSIYERFVEDNSYGWSHAETIAANMREVVRSHGAPYDEKAKAFDLAVRAAVYKNRFAAMDMCSGMVKAIQDNNLGLHIAATLLKHRDTFLTGLEPSECQCDSIRNAVRQIRQTQEPEQ